MDNLGYEPERSSNDRAYTEEDIIQAHIDTVNAAANVVVPLGEWRSKLSQLWKSYQWKMRHYFYIHLFVFFCNTLICGAIVWAIEQYKIPYIDCWFVSATCVFTCGLQTFDFALLSRASQSVLLFYTWISGKTKQLIDLGLQHQSRNELPSPLRFRHYCQYHSSDLHQTLSSET